MMPTMLWKCPDKACGPAEHAPLEIPAHDSSAPTWLCLHCYSAYPPRSFVRVPTGSEDADVVGAQPDNGAFI